MISKRSCGRKAKRLPGRDAQILFRALNDVIGWEVDDLKAALLLRLNDIEAAIRILASAFTTDRRNNRGPTSS
jgi:hypothetical protein